MAQLKDDCFAFGGDLMPLDSALKLLDDRIDTVVGIEVVSLISALGRVLSEDIIANRNVPPCDNSAVDGYAVFYDDLDPNKETRLPVTARVAAGHPLERIPFRGEAVRIFTGAPMPKGMETVFMEEDCDVIGDEVVLPRGLKRGANRRKKGEDIREGANILASGRILQPQDLGLIASIGINQISVRLKLRVAVFSTGDEVRDPNDSVSDGGIFDANRYSVIALLKSMHCDVTDLGILPDDEDAIASAVGSAASDHDVIITSGGVSAGEEDHVKAAIKRDGSIYLWRMAIKPGRPIAFGQLGQAVFIGLPGNPVAAMVTFMVIARPVLLMLMGAIRTLHPRYNVTANFEYKKKIGRREWLRANLSPGLGSELIAQKFPSAGAGILTSMVEADGLVELSEDLERVTPGDVVRFLPFSEVIG